MMFFHSAHAPCLYGPHPSDKSKRKEYRESTKLRVETTKPPKAAIAFLHEHTGQVWQGTFISKSDKVVYSDLVEAHKEDYKLNGRVSHRNLTTLHNHLIPFWSKYLPINYGEALAKKYRLERLDEGAAVASINRELAALNHELKLMYETKRLPYIPPLQLFPKEMETIREGFLEPADFYKILDHLEEQYQKDFAEFAYLSGWRSGKVKEMEWSNVFLNANPPYVRLVLSTSRTKKKLPIDLPLTGRLLDIIKRRSEERDTTSLRVFHRDGQNLSHVVRKSWYRACKAAGFRQVLIHDFRRSMARNLDEAGVRQKTIMARAGWTTTSMFLRYRISSTEDQAQANAAYERFIEQRQDSRMALLVRHQPKNDDKGF